MNNIEILEDLTNHIRFNEPLHYGIGLYIQAMENLIQEIKELKEENWIMRIVDKQYINKNKIKEKIEEIKKEEKQELKGLKGQDRYFIKQIYQAKRIVLEELLGEEGE